MERFWSKVKICEPPDGCWEWTAGRYPRGYGQFTVGVNKKAYAHRFAWELTNGPIPDGMFICHKCDNPPCVRPAHLFLGTRQDNSTDMVNKGRQQRGERHRRAVLSEAQVTAIKSSRGVTQHSLALLYGVSDATISLIRNGKHWRHVDVV